MRYPIVIAIGLSLLALSGCATSKAARRRATYGSTAQASYEKGMEELRDEDYLEALKLFTRLKNKFPFSRYATLAELRIADAFFEQEKYIEAVDAYKLFAKFHPTHPQVADGYAAYRVCEAYVKQIPGDWFLVPPSHEKDQSSARDAVRELKIFLRMYERSKYRPKVEELFRQSVRRLVDHELYVARFYLERDKPKATILRLEGVLKRYPDARAHPEVMLLLGKTYLKLDQRDKAKATFAGLIDRYPKDPHSAKARLFLQYINSRN